jgi:hypothetical protein
MSMSLKSTIALWRGGAVSYGMHMIGVNRIQSCPCSQKYNRAPKTRPDHPWRIHNGSGAGKKYNFVDCFYILDGGREFCSLQEGLSAFRQWIPHLV